MDFHKKIKSKANVGKCKPQHLVWKSFKGEIQASFPAFLCGQEVKLQG